MRPCFLATPSIRPPTAVSSVTSTPYPSRRSLLAPAALCSASHSSRRRYVTATVQPFSRKTRLTARPNPPVPPATKANLPPVCPAIPHLLPFHLLTADPYFQGFPLLASIICICYRLPALPRLFRESLLHDRTFAALHAARRGFFRLVRATSREYP